MEPLPFILTCDDAKAPDAPAWPDFLGFDAAIDALGKGNILDAIEARITAVENAGVKSVGVTGRPDRDGKVKLDAGIMTGWNGLAAAVGALEGYQSAFRVARRMLEMRERGEFTARFIAGPGAALFAQGQGMEPARSRPAAASAAGGQAHDTVGCIAFDGQRFAIGTSTSGGEGKFTDRIGDAALICNGFIASKACAAFVTWTGDTAMLLAMPKHVDVLVKQGVPIGEAVHAALAEFNSLQGENIGGVILHGAAADGCAVAGIGFDGPIEADFTVWRQGMVKPERRPVPKWSPTVAIPVY